MFPKSKRFRSPVSHGPPVGSYEVNTKAKNAGSMAFGKSKRFGQSKENLPGPCDTSVFLGDLSTCSGSSFSSSFRSTPRPKSNNRAKMNDLERTIENLKEELNYLREQNLQLTAEQLQNQDICKVSEERQTQTEPIEINNESENVRKELENLKIMHKCELEKCKADFDLEITRNMAFKSRIEALERSNQELCNDRDQVEDDHRRLQATKDDLTRENFKLSEKLDKQDEELQMLDQQMKIAMENGQNERQTLLNEKLNLSTMLDNVKHQFKDKEEKLTLALTSKKNELESLEKEKLEFVQKCKQLEHHIKIKEEQFTLFKDETQAELDGLQNENSQLTEKLHAKEDEFQISKGQLDSKVKELDLTKKEKSEFDQICKQLENEIQVLKEEMQQSLSTAEEDAANQKSEFDVLKSKYAEATKELEIRNKDIDIMEEELKLSKEKARKEIEALKGLLDKELIKTKAHEEEYSICIENMKNTMKNVDSLQNQKMNLEKKLKELEEILSTLEKDNQDLSINHKEEKEESEELTKRLQRENVDLCNKLDLEIVKRKAYEEKYTKSLKHYEENIANVTKTAEDLRVTNSELDKKICYLENLVEELRLREQDHEKMKKNNEEILKWKVKYEELLEKIEPFKEQLDAFEAEKTFLLGKHSEAQSEVSKLSEQYAKLLGHQNQKQKIHHVLKLKQENIDLKSELSKLRELYEKQKRMKQQEVSTVRKKFNPAEAFSHAKTKSEQ